MELPTTELLEEIRLGSLRLLSRTETIIYGHIVDYDPTRNTVRVALYPGSQDPDPGGIMSQQISNGTPSLVSESDLTNAMLIPDWIPLFTPWSGNGWGFQAGPVPGDMLTQCAVHISDNEDGTHMIFATFYHDQHVAPGAPAGELWMIHQIKDSENNHGTYAKLQNDGSMRVGGHVELFEKSPLIGLFGVEPDGSSKGTEMIEVIAPNILIQGAPGNGNGTVGNEEIYEEAPFIVLDATESDGTSNTGSERVWMRGGMIEAVTQGSSISVDLASSLGVVRQEDLQVVVNAFNSHVHSDAGGIGDSGPPTASTTANSSSLFYTM